MFTEHFTFNRIERLLEIEFGRKPKDYSWQAAKRRQSILSRFSEISEISQNPYRRQSRLSENLYIRQSEKVQSRFSKFFQSPEFSSVFNK
jgi:hypothetical protein